SSKSRALMLRLKKDLQSLRDGTISGICARPDEENTLRWDVYIEGPPDTCYEKGIFHLEMTFPDDYPQNPPNLRFLSDFWHPNVYPDGRVCISILHPPEQDLLNPEEQLAEKWRPIHNAASILLSVQSMLSDPNVDSIANVDPFVQWRDDRAGFVAKAEALSVKAFGQIPEFVRREFYEGMAPPPSKTLRFHDLQDVADLGDFSLSGGFDLTAIPAVDDDDWGDAPDSSGSSSTTHKGAPEFLQDDGWAAIPDSKLSVASSPDEQHFIPSSAFEASEASSASSCPSAGSLSRKRGQHPTDVI
ncbi:MAG: ubiquitin-conjugating enzyme family protein, partial [archaeon]|nr:ubiquitin-conjugating enzyme family protein [archaeon]